MTSLPLGELERETPGAPGAGDPDAPTKQIAGRSPTQLAIERFRKDRTSMVALVLVVLFVLMGLSAPLLVKLGVLDPFTFHTNLLDVDRGSIPSGRFGGISSEHWLGVEPGTGRDLASRLILGVTLSMFIALSATILAMVIGAVLGIVSGVSGGWADSVIGRAIDLTLSFPQVLMLIALSGMFVALLVQIGVPSGDAANATYVILILGLFGWPVVARVIRGQVLSIREREFVDAARLLGAPRRRIYFKEILPNLWAPLLVYVTLLLPAFVSAEAALAYLAVGVKPPTPTLGNILNDSILYANADFIYFFLPAFIIAVIVISFNLLGDGLRDALDPKANR
jgi:peptide/nickel transport system permease protein